MFSCFHGLSRRLHHVTLIIAALCWSGCQTEVLSRAPVNTTYSEDRPDLGPPHHLARALEGLTFEDGRVRPARREPTQVSEVEREATARALLEEGRKQLAAGQRTQAIELFARAVVSAPDLVEAYEHLGRGLSFRGQTSKALAAFTTALALDPRHLGALEGQARNLEREGRFLEAIETWYELLALAPDHGPARIRLAIDLNYVGDPETALEQLDAAGIPAPPQLRPLLETGMPPQAAIRNASAREPNAIVTGSMVRIDVGGGTTQAAETSVAVSSGPDGHIVAAWNDLRETGGVDAWSLGVGLSLDGGDTWTDSLLRAPGADLSDFEGDPMTAYDPRTGYLWVGGVTFFPGGNLYVARKAPGASTFEPTVTISDDNNFDKPWLAAGPAPGKPNSTRLYVAYNLGLQTSTDLGSTWNPALPLDFGVGQLPRVGPNGELYIAYWDFDDGMMLQRSFDGGASVGPPIQMAQRLDVWGTQDGSRFPGLFRVASLAYLAVDPNDGTLYCVYFDTTEVLAGQANVDLYFTRSADQGTTWTVPRLVNGDSDPPGDQFFPWLEVDAMGRLHMIFFDTRYTPQLDDAVDGRFDVNLCHQHRPRRQLARNPADTELLLERRRNLAWLYPVHGRLHRHVGGGRRSPRGLSRHGQRRPRHLRPDDPPDRAHLRGRLRIGRYQRLELTSRPIRKPERRHLAYPRRLGGEYLLRSHVG